MTSLGGADDLGTIFKINTDGFGYATLHEFATGKGDGHLPFGGLTLAGATLFGATAQGGSSNAGVVFKIELGGSGYTLRRQFTGSHGDPYNVENT